MAVFQCNIDIYILSDENLKHVLRLTLSVFERHESLLLTPDIFKPICSIENLKFPWPHAIECYSPVSRVLVTKEPRLVNTITFPARPGRPRGSQSGRDKRHNKSFQAPAEEIPRTMFYRPVPNGRSRSGVWLVPKNVCVFLPNQRVAGQGVQSALLPVLENLRGPVFPRPEVGKFNVFLLNAELSEGVEQAGENKTANFTWEWSLKICIANQ